MITNCLNLSFYLSVIVMILVLILVRIVAVLYQIRRHRSSGQTDFGNDRRKKPVKTMIVLGSGGHTTEMTKLVECLSDGYSPRHYIVANTDAFSKDKALALEKHRVDNKRISQYCMSVIPRSREVKQSWASTVFSTLFSLVHSTRIVLTDRPDLLLCNGPGTCVPLCIAAFLSRVFFIKEVKIVFVESICRVNSLSLSGLLLYPVADEFVVQWPQLKDKYPLVRYLGRVI